jgi:heterotetrameric sarcosine oxidase gamma subunit
MVDQLSPLAPVFQPGPHGNIADGIGVTLSELQPGSIVQVAAFPNGEVVVQEAVTKATMLQMPDGPGHGNFCPKSAVFGIGPSRYLVTQEDEGLAVSLAAAVGENGTVTDLSHGRTAIRIDGPKAEWVLSKLFAIDFSSLEWGAGVATNHHEIFAQIQRSGVWRYDLYVFRSFARSFWQTLCHAAEETGYEVR